MSSDITDKIVNEIVNIVREIFKEEDEFWFTTVVDSEDAEILKKGFTNAIRLYPKKAFTVDIDFWKKYADMDDVKIRKINDKLFELVVEGKWTKKDVVLNELMKLGLDEKRAELIAVTELNEIANKIREKAYELYTDADYFKWITERDDHVCEKCKKLSEITKDGVELNELKKLIKEVGGETAREFVLHPKCRCTFVKVKGKRKWWEKGKVYVSDISEAPEGAVLYRGPRGGIYYYSEQYQEFRQELFEIRDKVLSEYQVTNFELIEAWKTRLKYRDLMMNLRSGLYEKLSDFNARGISARVKSEFSIIEKMKRKGKKIEEMVDICGVRLYYNEKNDVYASIEKVISRLKELYPQAEISVDDKFERNKGKTYYRAIHLDIRIGDKRAEIQLIPEFVAKVASIGHKIVYKNVKNYTKEETDKVENCLMQFVERFLKERDEVNCDRRAIEILNENNVDVNRLHIGKSIEKQEKEEEWKDRVYIKPEDISKLPKGLKIYRGPRGGLYYKLSELRLIREEEKLMGGEKEDEKRERKGKKERERKYEFDLDRVMRMLAEDETNNKIREFIGSLSWYSDSDRRMRAILKTFEYEPNPKRVIARLAIMKELAQGEHVNRLKGLCESIGVNFDDLEISEKCYLKKTDDEDIVELHEEVSRMDNLTSIIANRADHEVLANYYNGYVAMDENEIKKWVRKKLTEGKRDIYLKKATFLALTGYRAILKYLPQADYDEVMKKVEIAKMISEKDVNVDFEKLEQKIESLDLGQHIEKTLFEEVYEGLTSIYDAMKNFASVEQKFMFDLMIMTKLYEKIREMGFDENESIALTRGCYFMRMWTVGEFEKYAHVIEKRIHKIKGNNRPLREKKKEVDDKVFDIIKDVDILAWKKLSEKFFEIHENKVLYRGISDKEAEMLIRNILLGNGYIVNPTSTLASFTFSEKQARHFSRIVVKVEEPNVERVWGTYLNASPNYVDEEEVIYEVYKTDEFPVMEIRDTDKLLFEMLDALVNEREMNFSLEEGDIGYITFYVVETEGAKLGEIPISDEFTNEIDRLLKKYVKTKEVKEMILNAVEGYRESRVYKSLDDEKRQAVEKIFKVVEAHCKT